MISMVAGRKAKCFVAVCLIAGFLDFNLGRIAAKDTTVRCGNCRITVLGAHFWRDWMPIVSIPGSDGGSRLHAKVKLSLNNSAGDSTRFTFRAAIVDDNGQYYPVRFHAFQNSQLIPDSGAPLDIGLNAGEIREIELAMDEGPYLPAGSSIHVWMEWSGNKGDIVVIQTPDQPIERTD